MNEKNTGVKITPTQALALALLRYKANPNQENAHTVREALAARRDELEAQAVHMMCMVAE